MWLFTRIGFFSAVQKTGTDFITIRARVKQDLENLKEHYTIDCSDIIGNEGTDYPWRIKLSKPAFASLMQALANDVTYSNFKNEVAKTQGKERAKAYSSIWSVMYQQSPDQVHARVYPELPIIYDQTSLIEPNWPTSPSGHHKLAYGAVVVSPDGKLLLREPRNHYDGYVWTFPKGRQDPGETPTQTALREVKEETGISGELIGYLPDEYLGGTSINRYFVMQTDATFDHQITPELPETQSLRWVPLAEAAKWISQTTNLKGRERDLKILAGYMSVALPNTAE